MWVRKPEREAGCGRISRRPKLQGGRSQNAREPQGSGAAIEERAWGVSAARGLEGRRAGDRRGLRQEPGGRGSEATQTTIIIGNHAAAKLVSGYQAQVWKRMDSTVAFQWETSLKLR